jgi:hypothetical protein
MHMIRLSRLSLRGIGVTAAALSTLTIAAPVFAAAKPLPPAKFCVDDRCVTENTSDDGGVYKWNPGHYMLLDKMGSTEAIRAEHFRQIDAIGKEPTVRGVKLMVYWSAVEGAPGDYSAGYAIIDQYLRKLAQYDKHLILSVQDRQFGGYDPTKLTTFFPSYIISGSQYGVTSMTNGISARSWQQPTMDRVIAMSKALASRYDKNPNFEIYQTEETAVGVRAGVDGYSSAVYLAQLKRLVSSSRGAWKNTMLRVSTNFLGDDQTMTDLINYCGTYNVAVGGPDTIPDQTIQANRIFNGVTGGKDLRGVLPFVSEVQSPSLGGHEGTFTPDQLYKHAMTEVRPNYFVWYRNTWAGGTAQKWDTGILPYIRSVKGAVKSTCPSKLGGKCEADAVLAAQ